MENKLVSIAEIREKGSWHYEPYSNLVTGKLAQLARSSFPQVQLRELVQEGGVGRGFTVRPDEQKEKGILLLTGRNIIADGLSLKDVRYISLEEHEKLTRTQLQRGDLLINTLLKPAVAAVYDSDQPANISSLIIRLRLRANVLPAYLANYLNSEIGQVLLKVHATGSIQRIANTATLMKLPILLPTLSEQLRLVKKADLAKKEASRLAKEAELLHQQAQNDFFSDLFDEAEE